MQAFDNHPAGGNSIEELFKFSDLFANPRCHGLGLIYAVKSDLKGNLHF